MVNPLHSLARLNSYKDFINMIDGEYMAGSYKAAYDYVSDHGMKIYCAVTYADKATISAVNDDPAVLYIGEFW